MSRYPRGARNARLKCITCNAPVVKTTDREFVCVDCGSEPVETRPEQSASVGADAVDSSRSTAN